MSGQPAVRSSSGQPWDGLGGAAFERLVDTIACAIYQEGCFAYYGGDVGMTYWRDLSDEEKQPKLEDARKLILGVLLPSRLSDPLEGANCGLCGATADNFYVSDDLWGRVGLGHVQACFKCFRIAAWHKGIRPDPGWRVSA